jgi:hypothetical protein
MGDRQRRALVERGLNEVWAYQQWPDLFEQVFHQAYSVPDQKPLDEYDRDGQPDNPRHGGEPESVEHKALKNYVLSHPSALRLSLGNPVGRVERDLLSGDRMDVEFIDGPRRIGIEVKSIRSGWSDLRRGIYQCVKYRAVMIAQSGFDPKDSQCEAVLVTEQLLPSDLKALARQLAVPHRIVRVN